MKLLKKILDTLPSSQRRSITATLAELERAGVVTRDELARKRRDLLSKVGENPSGPTFVPVLATPLSKVSSEAWNGMQERVYSDLVVLYDQVGEMAARGAQHGQLTHTNLTASRLAILKLIEQIRVYQFLRANPEYQDVRFLSFLDGRNETLRRPKAVIDPYVTKLELPARFRERLQQANLDLRQTTVTTQVVGEGLVDGLSREFGVENMLDADPDTFWGEMVLADAPITQAYEASWGLHASQGMLVEVDIDLNRTERVNNVRMLPFGSFPVRVIDLAYKTTVKEDGWTTMPGFAPQDATLDWLEFDFQPTHVGVLRVVLEQPNYTRQLYHLPRKIVENIVLWEQIFNDRYDQVLHQVQLGTAEAALVDAEPEQLAVLNALDIAADEMLKRSLDLSRTTQLDVENDQLQSLGQVLSGVKPTAQTDLSEPAGGGPVADLAERVEVAKYEYLQGIRAIEISRVFYEPFSYYASPKLAPGATVLEVELETTEEHVEFTDDFGPYHRSSTEYELEVAENRRFALLPVAADSVVKGEYIAIERRSRKGRTRFPVASFSTNVRKNGMRMNFGDYTFDGATGEPATLTIAAAAYDPNAVYTLDYGADETASLVDMNDIPSTALLEPEVHSKTDQNNRLELNYYPYVEYSVINDADVSWEKIDDEEARWRFTPSVANVTSLDGSRVQFSTTTGMDVISGDISAFTGVDPVYVHVDGETQTYPLNVLSSTHAEVLTAYEGDTGLDVKYELGEGVLIDGQVFGLSNSIYEPLEIFVNDQKAVNITAYEDFEHPAFLPGEPGRRFQYIHAGRNIYFNTAIPDGQIEVIYRWKTQYLRLVAKLRSNFPIFTEVTPKLVDATLKLKTTRL